ncbi:MAG: hypothetical protein LBJ87_09840 [bacterium]|jgi:DNA-binding NarL/FixJ family response regulator|nr:hypothetical protein [bacterium]
MGEASLITVLLVEDRRMGAAGLRRVLTESRDIAIVGTADDQLTLADLSDSIQPDVVLVGFCLSDGEGSQAAGDARRTWPGTAVYGAYDRHWDLLELLQRGP